MILVNAITEPNGVVRPEEPLPDGSILIIGSPEGYACYFRGDELPNEYASQFLSVAGINPASISLINMES